MPRSRGKRIRGRPATERHEKMRKLGPKAWKKVLEEALLTEKQVSRILGGRRYVEALKKALFVEAVRKAKAAVDHETAAARAVATARRHIKAALERTSWWHRNVTSDALPSYVATPGEAGAGQ